MAAKALPNCVFQSSRAEEGEQGFTCLTGQEKPRALVDSCMSSFQEDNEERFDFRTVRLIPSTP